MSRLSRCLQRVLILLIAAATLWFIVTQLFDRLEQHVPIFFALFATYVLAAYVLLPPVIHASVALLRRNRIPRVTRAADGLPADPVNIVLIGSQEQLRRAFTASNWVVADPLTLRTSVKMIAKFVLNRPYPAAPFSALYLFGRKQDIGFQEAVGHSPRKRHHVRFWAADTDPETEVDDLSYWTKRRRTELSRSCIWVGAATTDMGFGLQALTYQISHRVDRNTDRERDYIESTLRSAESIREGRYIDAGTLLGTRFVSDGRIFFARLIV